MVSEQLLREAGWSEEVIEAVRQVSSTQNRYDDTVSADSIQPVNEVMVKDSNSIALNSALQYDFSWPKLDR